MKPKNFVIPAINAVLIASCISGTDAKTEEHEKPNFFLYIADDLGYRDLGATGNPYVKTPNIDQFAKNGIEFTKMYTATAMCTPSRSTLFTGLYPHRHGCHMNHGYTHKEVRSLPEYLKPLGYNVALVGKRHIKPTSVYTFDYVKFDSLNSYLSSKEPPFCVIWASFDPHRPHEKAYPNPDSVLLPAKWVDTKQTRENLLGYYYDIEKVDKEFSEFLKTIKSHNLDKNSLIAFTSDHGYEYYAKWSCYEAGIKVPFFLQANGYNINVEEVDELTGFIDFVPTMIELGGGQPPLSLDGRSFLPLLKDSQESIHQYIFGTHTTRGIISGKAYPIRSITDGTWKYIRNLNHEDSFQNIITNGWDFTTEPSESWKEWLVVKKNKSEGYKWVEFYQKRPYEELYNLKNDEEEVINLASKHEYSEILDNLSRELDKWMKLQNDSGMQAEMAVPLVGRDRDRKYK